LLRSWQHNKKRPLWPYNPCLKKSVHRKGNLLAYIVNSNLNGWGEFDVFTLAELQGTDGNALSKNFNLQVPFQVFDANGTQVFNATASETSTLALIPGSYLAIPTLPSQTIGNPMLFEVSDVGSPEWQHMHLLLRPNGPNYSDLGKVSLSLVPGQDSRITATSITLGSVQSLFDVSRNGYLGDLFVTDGIITKAYSLNGDPNSPGGEWSREENWVSARNPQLMAITDAASFKVVPLAPGQWATAWHVGLGQTLQLEASDSAASLPLPTIIRRTKVILVDSTGSVFLCPVDYSSQIQTNFLVPLEAALGDAQVFLLLQGSEYTNLLPITIIPTAPQIFTSNGVAAALHQNYTLVTQDSPAQPGEYVSLFGTGFGAISPAVPTGQAAPESPLSWVVDWQDVQVTLDGMACPVQFVGLSPGLADLYQVNFQVPDIGPGKHSLVISATQSQKTANFSNAATSIGVSFYTVAQQ
jgi:uncharacterized protein (TIGR03437 family)